MIRFMALAGLAALCWTGPVLAQDLDFGDDASEYSNDGECDDPRFEGPGMTSTPLLDADIAHDATDCAAAFEAGQIAPRAAAEAAAEPESDGKIIIDSIDFGDDSSQYATDTECDDPRFEGPGMASAVVDADIGRDATDCAAAYVAGDISLRAAPATADASGGAVDSAATDGIDFGDDTSSYANDGECDDPRFEGPGAATALLEADLGHDATDCQAAFAAGRVSLRGDQVAAAPESGPEPAPVPAPAPAPAEADGIDFGDDSGNYPSDGECDDPRFEGAAMASTLDAVNIAGDATDCAAAYAEGMISLAAEAPVAESLVIDGIDFGDDSGSYPSDGECDDPRFAGDAMATALDETNIAGDATDCAAAYAEGSIMLDDGSGMSRRAPVVSPEERASRRRNRQF